MKGIIKSFPVALKMIFIDPVNIVLSIFPTIIALAFYLFTINTVYRNSDRFISFFRGYIYTADQATLLAKILTAVLIIFLFFIMSWTFLILVGIISAPFNSLLSARIEQKLVQRIILDEDQKHAIANIKSSMAQTFKNEFKKLIFLMLTTTAAFLMNMIPVLYPLGIFIVATLVAIQFVDYSWSRNNMHFTDCLEDLIKNIIPYSVSGIIFLALVAIPLVNAFIPAFATSYFTVLWLYLQKRIDLSLSVSLDED